MREERMVLVRSCTRQCLLLFIGILIVVIACNTTPGYAKSTFGVLQNPLRSQLHRKNGHSLYQKELLQILRGGSTAEATGEDDDDVDDLDEDDSEEITEEEKKLASVMSSQPVKLHIQTNWGNSVVDHKLEINAARTRDVASLKKSVSRLLPGRPPLLGLELVYEGRVLDDDMLVDELFDDDDEEDEEEDEDEEDAPSKTLILNALPPVDPKFATELRPKLKAHMEDDDDTLSTEELLDAYYLNQAAMSRNSQLLVDPNTHTSPLMRLEVQELATQLREQLQSQTPEDVWEASLAPVKKSLHTEERRGQRYRSGKGGASTNLKKSIQTNMNINWGETIRNCLLFLFFGYFGGRNSLSRSLMLWGAPLCFILQARPVKLWSKTLFYMMTNPPSIVLSLLPAPQQAILALDLEKSFAALYKPDDAGKPVANVALDEKIDDDDEEEEEAEEEETDDEEEEDKDESSDEYDSEDDE